MPDAMEFARDLPVAVIGAGPVGLAAGAQLLARGKRVVVLEAGAGPGTAIRAWGHVRMFSPWRFNIDGAARALLEAGGWQAPDAEVFPTGADLAGLYVEPLAATLARAGVAIRYGARVVGVSRRHHDRLHSGPRAGGLGREAAPFVLHIAMPDGRMEAMEAGAVIDASGTWSSPNPAGAHGMAAPGEAAHAARIDYGIPDVQGARRADFAGRTTLVLGGGHSGMNAVLDLVALRREAPGTCILWAFRSPLGAVNFGGGSADGLSQRGALGADARGLVESGAVEALAPFLVHRIEAEGDALRVHGDRAGRMDSVVADRIIVATGFRPDLSFLGELRLELDPAVQATPSLAPLIDPNEHSCGSVRPHGEAELRHPREPGFYMAGMKAYGRAPTFLLATGHEQVRSIAAFLSGDVAAARRVELVLPETGVCSTDRVVGASACCARNRSRRRWTGALPRKRRSRVAAGLRMPAPLIPGPLRGPKRSCWTGALPCGRRPKDAADLRPPIMWIPAARRRIGGLCRKAHPRLWPPAALRRPRSAARRSRPMPSRRKPAAARSPGCACRRPRLRRLVADDPAREAGGPERPVPVHRQHGAGRFGVYSAGSFPKGMVHPLTLRVLAERGTVSDAARGKSWDEFARPDAPRMDVVVTVCDAAAGESCPLWPGVRLRAHWGVPDPAAAEGDEATRLQAFRDAFATMEAPVLRFVALDPAAFDRATLDRAALQSELDAIGRH